MASLRSTQETTYSTVGTALLLATHLPPCNNGADIQQAIIGSCDRSEIAVYVQTRVVGHYPERGHLIIDAGFTAISNQGADIGYGEIAGHPELRIVGLTQELGKIEAAPGHKIDFDKVPIGTILRILPFHVWKRYCAAIAEG